jgi:hypothetical protein
VGIVTNVAVGIYLAHEEKTALILPCIYNAVQTILANQVAILAEALVAPLK